MSTSSSLVNLSTRLNPIVSAILRSPLHGLLSAGLMLITVTGRKSGRVYTIPVGYHDVGDAVVILVSEAKNKAWWKNYLRPGPITLRIRGVERQGVAEVVPGDSAEFRQRAEASLNRGKVMRHVLGVAFDPRTGLTGEQVNDLRERIAIVRVRYVASPVSSSGCSSYSPAG